VKEDLGAESLAEGWLPQMQRRHQGPARAARLGLTRNTGGTRQTVSKHSAAKPMPEREWLVWESPAGEIRHWQAHTVTMKPRVRTQRPVRPDREALSRIAGNGNLHAKAAPSMIGRLILRGSRRSRSFLGHCVGMAAQYGADLLAFCRRNVGTRRSGKALLSLASQCLGVICSVLIDSGVVANLLGGLLAIG
jgi:hypothetical protein